MLTNKKGTLEFVDKIFVSYVSVARFESKQTQEGGELCFIKYCQIFVNSRYACSDRVFLTQQKVNVSGNKEHTILR